MSLIKPLEDKYAPVEVKKPKELITYRPQPKQLELVRAAGLLDWWENGGVPVEPVARLIGYGGAAFGGKTYGMLGLAAMLAWAFPGIQMGFFRRTYTEMKGPGAAMNEARELFLPSGGSSRDGGKEWSWANGSSFYFRHVEYEKDVYKYQSQQMDFCFVDEATHFTWYIIDYLITRNRATSDAIVKPFMVLCSNPGGIGHGWYDSVFNLSDGGIHKWKSLKQSIEIRNPNEELEDVYFIPSYLDDNKIGTDRDPDYEVNLSKRSEDIYLALRWGDWDTFSGRAFKEFEITRHVIKAIPIPDSWAKWRGVDWGWSAMFYCLWLAKNPSNGQIHAYREIFGTHITSTDQAQAIGMNTPFDEVIHINYADPSMWGKKNVDGIVKSAADDYAKNGIILYRADNNRIAGKRKIHGLLANQMNDKPGIVFHDTCYKIIELLPKLSSSMTNKEDVQDQDGDDPYDCLRYALTNTDVHTKGTVRKSREHINESGMEELSAMF